MRARYARPPVPAWLPSIRGLPRSYWFLWAGALVNRIGGFVAPFLALYLTDHLHLSVERAGVVISCFGLGSFLASPLGGYLSDARGRRPTMLLSLTAGPAALVALGFARSPTAIAVAAFATGLLGDMYRAVNQAIVADLIPPADRPRAYGILYWAVNLGFSIAAVLAGLLARHRFWLLFAGDAATTLAFAALFYLRVPETRPERTGSRPPWRAGDLLAPLADLPFAGFVLVILFSSLIFLQAFSTLPIDMRAHGVSPESYGLVMALNGVLIVLLQPTATALLPRLRRSRVLAASALLVGAGYGLNALATSVPLYALALAVWTLGEIAQAPIASAVVADLAPVARRGTYQGFFLMAWGTAAVVAPSLGAQLLGHFGSDALWGACFALGLLAAAGHLALAPARGRRLARLRSEPALVLPD
jgi:MFS family permease